MCCAKPLAHQRIGLAVEWTFWVMLACRQMPSRRHRPQRCNAPTTADQKPPWPSPGWPTVRSQFGSPKTFERYKDFALYLKRHLGETRHTNATELLRNGVPIAEVSRRLGHADQNITLSIYSHAVPADSSAAVKVWNDALGDVIQAAKKPGPPRSIAEYCRVLHGWKQKEENGGDDGARTRDLRRDRPAF
jgi:hypothetical protein